MVATRCFREAIDDANPRAAVRRIVEGAGTDAPALTCMFVDAQYDLDGLAVELRRQVHGPILACTSAGHQTDQSGIVDHGMVAAAIVTDRLHAVIEPMHGIGGFGVAEAQAVAGKLGLDRPERGGTDSRFGVMLIDGMGSAQERVTALLYGACNGLPLVGGSAGDGERFGTTYVFDGERFVSDAAVLARIDTTLRFRTFGYQNFKPGPRRLVVTRAVTEKRQILELDGEPAPQVYREAIGQQELTTQVVARHPLLLRWDGRDYARAIRAWDHDRLDLFCAIEEGMVVRVGQPEDLVGMSEQQLSALRGEMGGDVLVVAAFTCFHRRLEVERLHEQERYRRVIAQYPLFGFCTYGEQYNGLHLNQMATGFILGA